MLDLEEPIIVPHAAQKAEKRVGIQRAIIGDFKVMICVRKDIP